MPQQAKVHSGSRTDLRLLTTQGQIRALATAELAGPCGHGRVTILWRSAEAAKGYPVPREVPPAIAGLYQSLGRRGDAQAHAGQT